jgi:hypothetical protein
MAIADLPAQASRVRRHRQVNAIDVDVVIATTVQLGETHLLLQTEETTKHTKDTKKESEKVNSSTRRE